VEDTETWTADTFWQSRQIYTGLTAGRGVLQHHWSVTPLTWTTIWLIIITKEEAPCMFTRGLT